ncbi:hypothetical protein HDU97_001388 [Phlyctochytrium planicorne]|nr:hypothetical protein HDU97_001388 [Phlyctochytrium planicorne]
MRFIASAQFRNVLDSDSTTLAVPSRIYRSKWKPLPQIRCENPKCETNFQKKRRMTKFVSDKDWEMIKEVLEEVLSSEPQQQSAANTKVERTLYDVLREELEALEKSLKPKSTEKYSTAILSSFEELENQISSGNEDMLAVAAAVYIQSCCNSQHIDLARRLLRKYVEKLRLLDVDIDGSDFLKPFRVLINHYADGGDKDGAVEVMRELREADLEPTLSEVFPLVMMCKVDDIDFVLQAYHSFNSADHTLPFLNKVFSLCLEAGSEYSNVASEIYGSLLQRNNNIPPAATLDILLKKADNVDDFDTLYQDIKSYGLLEDNTLQISLLKCSERLSKEGGGFATFLSFTMLLQKDTILSAKPLKYVLTAYVKAKELKLALSFLERHRSSIKDVPYPVLLEALAASSEVAETDMVWRILADMVHTRSRDGAVTVEDACLLIHTFGVHGDSQGVFNLLCIVYEKMKLLRPPPAMSRHISNLDNEEIAGLFPSTDSRVLQSFIGALCSPRINDPNTACELLKYCAGAGMTITEEEILQVLQAESVSLSSVAKTAIIVGTPLSEERAIFYLAKSPKFSRTMKSTTKANAIQTLAKRLVTEVDSVLIGDDLASLLQNI